VAGQPFCGASSVDGAAEREKEKGGPVGGVPRDAGWHRRGQVLVAVRAGRHEWRAGVRWPTREENGAAEPR
jgi:hypothetical protein